MAFALAVALSLPMAGTFAAPPAEGEGTCRSNWQVRLNDPLVHPSGAAGPISLTVASASIKGRTVTAQLSLRNTSHSPVAIYRPEFRTTIYYEVTDPRGRMLLENTGVIADPG